MKKPYQRSLIVLLAAVLALTFGLSACGKKGDPEPPDGTKDEFPRQYPDPSTL
jgi:predicted small lipoprotein YifL